MSMRKDNIIYFPNNVQEQLVTILDEVFYFSIHTQDELILTLTEELIMAMGVSEDLADRSFSQLVWWITFCLPIGKQGETIYKQYLMKNKQNWGNKGPLLKEVLVSWLNVSPGFYYVENNEIYSEKVFTLCDLFERKNKLVCIYNEIFQPPKRGELVTGLLIPMGNGTYTNQNGFLHLPQDLSHTVTHEIVSYFNHHAKSPNYQLNSHLYPQLITLALQTIEREI
ncbi:hypothetical protein QGM71_19570 [Virgibacillus sp. C22-A2]|uniref:Uncharacterized protein n=1 Tax=Virgibacillus tibetensis TaxID=3042313 RepID=A0ABU6KMC8_9BACI|nr:hypothetical protein [Virgibacillus sp. C22-A2]